MKKIFAALTFCFLFLSLSSLTHAYTDGIIDKEGLRFVSVNGGVTYPERMTDNNTNTYATIVSRSVQNDRWGALVFDKPKDLSRMYYYSLSYSYIYFTFHDASGAQIGRIHPTSSGYTDINYRQVKEIRILNSNSGSGSANANEVEFWERIPPPNAPTGLTAKAEVESVYLQWQASPEPDLQGYRVYQNSILIAEVPKDQNFYLVENLPPEVNYAYQVSAVGQSGESSKSKSVIAAALTAPKKPILNYTALTEKSVRLTWDEGFAQYEVYVDGRLYTRPSVGVKFIDVTGLTPETSYDFYVIGIDRFGRRVQSDTLTLTTLAAIPRNPLLLVREVTHDSFLATWQTIEYAIDYSIYLDDTLIDKVTVANYRFTGLEPEKTYVVKVVANGLGGTGQGTATVTTRSSPVPEITYGAVTPTDDPAKKKLTYTANELVEQVKVYLNGEYLGTYPVSEKEIDLDFTDISDKFADVRLEPDPEGKSFEFKALRESTGESIIDNILAPFVGAFAWLINAFVYLAIGVIPITILATAFFWYRKKYKRLLPDRKGDNKPFGYVDENKRHKNALVGASNNFAVDGTPNEKQFYKRYEKPKDYFRKKTGMQVVDKNYKAVSVGFLGMGGVKYKADHTYQRNGVQYKRRYVKGQGHVFVPKDLDNRVKLMKQNVHAVKRMFKRR